jgi:predicted CXXCH cytochrome family protein
LKPNRFAVIATALVLSLGWAARAEKGYGPFSEAATVEQGPYPSSDGDEPGFVGAAACESCHQRTHDTWKSGRHSKMVQPATTASVKGDFSKGRVTLRGSAFRFRVEGGQFFITESFLTGKQQEHRVEYTLGNRRIQHYLTTLDDGWIIVLPPSWDVQRREWFHNVEIVRPDEDAKKLVQQWNKSCVGCHVSQEEVNYNPATRTYATQWMDFGTSCERCHGPGSAHVQQYTRSDVSRPVDQRRIVRPTRLDPNTSSMICAQCHSLREIIAPGFKAGEDYSDYFRPILEHESSAGPDPAYWPDGRPRRFSNDASGLWQSECFLRGGATCTSCHADPHAPDVDQNAELAATNNALCTQCHKDIGARLTSHTRHRAESTGSSCIECHMPKTVVSIKATMRDHTISLPAPENTVAFGIPNACTECHADRKAAWAVDQLGTWWPQGRRAKLVARAEAFTAGRAQRPEALDRLIAIAADDRNGPLVQANAIGYLRNYAGAGAVAAILAAANADQPVIREAAISSLKLSSNRPIGERTGGAARATLFRALDDPRRSVRLSALASIINVGGEQPNADEEKRFGRVGREFAAKARLYEDNAKSQADLGAVHLLTGEFDLAATALVNSISLEPNRPTTTFLLALARLGQQRYEDGRALLKRVPPSDPYYKTAQERLKMLEPSK